jgi:hypothetical protein
MKAFQSDQGLAGSNKARPVTIDDENAVITIHDDVHFPYDTSGELTDEHPYYSSEFQAAVEGGRQIAQQVRSALETSKAVGEFGKDLNVFVEKAKILADFHPKTTHSIALLGDSGEGMSLPLFRVD